MTQQTAVEWLIENLPYMVDVSEDKLELIFDMALKMEKEQIIISHINGRLVNTTTFGIDVIRRKIKMESEDYYLKTYGGGK